MTGSKNHPYCWTGKRGNLYSEQQRFLWLPSPFKEGKRDTEDAEEHEAALECDTNCDARSCAAAAGVRHAIFGMLRGGHVHRTRASHPDRGDAGRLRP